MCIEEKISQIEKNNFMIASLLKENLELAKDLRESKEEEWDFMSVATASRKTEISSPVIYKKIESGELKSYRLGSKIFIKLTDLKNFIKES